MLGEELSEQGYHASYVYCDAQMMEIAKAQMELLEGRVPEKANEVVVSEYFLSTYGNNAKIGDTVTLDTESFHGDYVVTGIMDSVNEKEANTCAIILSNAALTEWDGFDPAGYRAYAHFKSSDQLGEELMTSYCREIAEEYQLPMPCLLYTSWRMRLKKQKLMGRWKSKTDLGGVVSQILWCFLRL